MHSIKNIIIFFFQLEHTHFDPPMSVPVDVGFVNPVHDTTFEETNLDRKSVASEATSGVASATVDSDDDDNFFKDSAA